MTIRDLTVGPAPRPGVVVGARGSLTVEGLAVEATRVSGMVLLGDLEARALLVRDTGPRAVDLEFGRGLLVQGGAQVVLEGAVIEGNTDVGVSVADAGTGLAISDAVIRDTAPRPSSGLGGAGLVVDLEAAVTASRLLLEHNLYAALISYGAASVDVTHGVFRDTQSSSTGGTRGNGAAVEEGATVRLAATLLERNRDTGLLVRAGAEAILTDLVVRETEPQRSDDRYGWGLSVESASRATLERGLLEGNRDLGIFAAHEGTTLAARDLVVRDTRPRPDGRVGRGLTSVEGASTTFANALFEGNREISLLFADSGTVAELTDVVVRDTLPDETTGAAGRALSVQDSAALRLARSLVERNPGLNLMAALSADLSAEDLVIRGVDGPVAGERGRGLVVQQGATARVLRGLLEGTRDAAVLVVGEGTSAEMEEVRILETCAQDCASCVRPAGGTALVSVHSAAVTLRDFEIRGADLCGVLLAQDGEIDLFSGRVAGCAIGGSLQVPGYDLDRLSAGVAYQDNGTNLDATSLPVPEATAPSVVPEMP